MLTRLSLLVAALLAAFLPAVGQGPAGVSVPVTECFDLGGGGDTVGSLPITLTLTRTPTGQYGLWTMTVSNDVPPTGDPIISTQGVGATGELSATWTWHKIEIKVRITQGSDETGDMFKERFKGLVLSTMREFPPGE